MKTIVKMKTLLHMYTSIYIIIYLDLSISVKGVSMYIKYVHILCIGIYVRGVEGGASDV